jgi:hypothetical protein
MPDAQIARIRDKKNQFANWHKVTRKALDLCKYIKVEVDSFNVQQIRHS